MSAILIFSPRNQKVSPSTTQVILRVLPQIENASVALFEDCADTTDPHRHAAMADNVATTGKTLNFLSPQFSDAGPVSLAPDPFMACL